MPEVVKANEAFFNLKVEGGEDLFVLSFTGREHISQLFEFNLRLESENREIDPESMIGQNAEFAIHSSGYDRSVFGVVSRFHLIGLEREKAIYTMRIVPHLALLTHRYNCRMFQDMSYMDILISMLNDSGVLAHDYSTSTRFNYPIRNYSVQYRESDFAFVSRLAETCGIFYYFDYTANPGETIFADTADVHSDIPDSTINFRFAGGRRQNEDYVFSIQTGISLRTAKHTVTDYNYISPDLDLTKEHTGAGPDDLEMYDYPGHYDSQDAGAEFAEVKSQADDCLRAICRGESISVRLAPGYKFKLINHPIDSINQTYLVTAVEHKGSQPAPDNARDEEIGYSNHIKFQKADIPYRPPLKTPRPRIYGSQTATVTGPDGHEIYSDEYGRVKVRFHWDRSGSANESSSCWIRTAQKWAGKSWGAMFIPRIGQEVLVDFLEGDPDRPIISGSVYNGTNVTPYTLPDDQTKTTIKSNSSMGGEGFNEFRFEDKKGSEQIFIQAEKDYDTLTKNNKTANVDGNETLSVKKSRSRSVGGSESVSVSGKRTHTVKKDENISVEADQNINVGKDRSTAIGKNEKIEVGEDFNFSVAKNSTVDIKEDEKYIVNKNRKVLIGEDYTSSVGKKYGLTVNKKISIVGGEDIELKGPGGSIVIKKNGDITIKGKKITIKGSGDVIIKGSKVQAN